MSINYSAQDESPPATSIFEKTGGVLDGALESPSDSQNKLYKRDNNIHFYARTRYLQKDIAVVQNGGIAVYIIKHFLYQMNSPTHCQPQSMWSLPTGKLRVFKTVATFTSTDGRTKWKVNIFFHLIFKIVLRFFTYCWKNCKVSLKKQGNKSSVSQFVWETAKTNMWLLIINPTYQGIVIFY